MQFPPERGKPCRRFGQKRLPTEAGFDAHDQDKVDFTQIREDCLHRGGRAHADAHPATCFADRRNHSGRIPPHAGGFDVERDERSARFGKVDGVPGRVVNHQVDIIIGIGQCAVQAAEHRRAIGHIGHKMAVHYINVQHIRPGFQRKAALVSQMGQIGRKN